jgi:hypothetical protein
MTRDELDTMWQQALHESVVAGEDFIRYHFAALVAVAEREACAKVCEVLANSFEHGAKEWAHADMWDMAEACAMRIRLRGE